MKPRFSTFIFAGLMLACMASFSQPTLTASGCNPVLGESVNYYNGTHQSQGSAGANQTWDYTALAGSQAETYSWVLPSSTPVGSSFPNANFALYSPTAGAIYYDISATAQTGWGTYSQNVAIPYSNPEDLIRFPFTLGNTYIDTWAGQFTNAGYTFYRSGTTTVTADAYGTMITPAGTFSNVLRVHFVQDYQDSANLGVPFVSAYYNDEYIWYKDGTHFPIASTFTLTTPGGTTSSSGYSSAGTVGIEPSDLLASANLFPNPASERLMLDFTLVQSGDVGVLVFNSVGQQVHVLQAGKCGSGLNQFQLDVDALVEGVYFAKILVGGEVASTKRFVVAR